MIIPQLSGGLGNQMFQIACAFGYAKRNNIEFAINYDLPHTCIQGKHPKTYKNTLFKNVPTTTSIPTDYYDEVGFAYQDIPKINKDFILRGYWQSEKYFNEYRDEVKDLFYFSEKDKEKWNKISTNIPLESIIGCHVRIGDYVHYEHIHPCQSKTYYNSAVEYFERNNTLITTPVVDNVIICCDDWLSFWEADIFKQLPYIKYYSTQGSTELQDMYILSQCKKLIMSNSSFSWWGAYLGSPHNDVVIPKQWFGHGGPQDYNDIYNQTWFKL